MMYSYSRLTRKVCEILDEYDIIEDVFKSEDRFGFDIFDRDKTNWEYIKINGSKIGYAELSKDFLFLRCHPCENCISPLNGLRRLRTYPHISSDLHKCINQTNKEKEYYWLQFKENYLCVAVSITPKFVDNNYLNYQTILRYLNGLEEVSREAANIVEIPLTQEMQKQEKEAEARAEANYYRY